MEKRNTEQSDGVTKFKSYVEKGLEDFAVGGDTTLSRLYAKQDAPRVYLLWRQMERSSRLLLLSARESVRRRRSDPERALQRAVKAEDGG